MANRREESSVPRRVASMAALSSCVWAVAARGQMIKPPQTVWGEVEQAPQGLQVGGVELLAGLLLALTLMLGVSTLLAVRRRTRAALLASSRLRRRLAWCIYGATPLLGLAILLIAGPRQLFGVEVALLGIALSAATVLLGTASLMTVRA